VDVRTVPSTRYWYEYVGKNDIFLKKLEHSEVNKTDGRNDAHIPPEFSIS